MSTATEARAHLTRKPDERLAATPLCRLCAREAPVAVLAYDTINGRTSQELCGPCIGSTALRPYYRNFHMNAEPTTTDRILAGLDTNKKCSGCGEATTGAHWHFAGTTVRQKVDKSGRAYYCSDDCCPLTMCKNRAVAEWSEDEFVFEDDDSDDEFVFGDDDESDDEYVFDDDTSDDEDWDF